jgi:phosphoribosyl-AMP cyclohydrolase
VLVLRSEVSLLRRVARDRRRQERHSPRRRKERKEVQRDQGKEAKLNLDALKWDENGLISVIFQDHETGEVLVLGYMSREALERTLETGKAHLYRRSHGRVMMKGETSGNVQLVKEVWVDCDADAMVMKIEQMGGAACHQGYRSCFHRKLVQGELKVMGERVFDPREVYGE